MEYLQRLRGGFVSATAMEYLQHGARRTIEDVLPAL
jgi:hypothetical protein